jgi:predicted secreted protein
MTLGHVGFSLSREQRARVEGEAQNQAIERFKAKAADLARGFGFAGYTLREVAVNANDPGYAAARACWRWRPRRQALTCQCRWRQVAARWWSPCRARSS